jgi:hypothetical protein
MNRFLRSLIDMWLIDSDKNYPDLIELRVYFNLLLCFFSSLCLATAVGIMRETQGWHNLALLLPLLNMLFYSVSGFLLNYFVLMQKRYSALCDVTIITVRNFYD